MNDETEFKLIPIRTDKNTNFILFKVNLPPKITYTFLPVTLSDNEPKLGQTLISIGGEIENTVSVGRVVSLEMKDSIVGTSTIKYLSSIDTDVSAKDLVNGSPVLNLSGSVVGMKLGNDDLKSFTPVATLKKDIDFIIETIPKVQ